MVRSVDQIGGETGSARLDRLCRPPCSANMLKQRGAEDQAKSEKPNDNGADWLGAGKQAGDSGEAIIRIRTSGDPACGPVGARGRRAQNGGPDKTPGQAFRCPQAIAARVFRFVGAFGFGVAEGWGRPRAARSRAALPPLRR